MRPRRILIFVVLTVFAVWVYRGVRGDARMSVKKLKGLTPEQVIARVGPPEYDPRLPTYGSWTPADEASGDPLKFYYHDPWSLLGHEYAIVFRGGRVVDVKTGTK